MHGSDSSASSIGGPLVRCYRLTRQVTTVSSPLPCAQLAGCVGAYDASRSRDRTGGVPPVRRGPFPTQTRGNLKEGRYGDFLCASPNAFRSPSREPSAEVLACAGSQPCPR